MALFFRGSYLCNILKRNVYSNAVCSVHTVENSQNEDTSYKENIYGQPTIKTHPHLLNDGELTPGISRDEYKKRRDNFMDLVCSETRNTLGSDKYNLVIVPSATKVYMSDKIPYVFRQNTDFFYLSGCLEPDTALVLTGNSRNFISTMFMREQDSHTKLWDGPRTDKSVASEFFCVEQALSVSDFEQFLSENINTHPDLVVYYDTQNAPQPNLHKIIIKCVFQHHIKVLNLVRTFSHKIRLIKSPSEQRLMKKTCDVASESINKAISISNAGLTEHQIFATIDYETRMRGAEILAYPPVVASGINTNIIHYINNTRQIEDGDLVLVDAGCEYHGYCSDITRTWPINGKFNDAQRVLYEVLLHVQTELIKMCADKLSLDYLYRKMIELLGTQLKSAGIITKEANSSYRVNQIVSDLCPHHVSHYLGMDVHDTSTIPRNINLKSGMVITVEPGVYINRNIPHISEEFRNLGIRIEDDVLITDSGYDVLSSKCVKQVSDIEKLLR